MSQEIEIEFKNLLTEQEFHRILQALPFPKQAFIQTNFYFETEDFQLKAMQSALRIRQKNETYQLTLKQPHELGLLETHDTLTKKEANQWLQGNIIPKENTYKALKQLGISLNELNYFGSLLTKRREFKENDILYVLDHSIYQNKEDYELEIEASRKEYGEKMFESFLHRFDIPKRNTKNKIERLYTSIIVNRTQ